MSVEFNKFLKYYTNSRDLNEAERGKSDERGKSRDDENMTRFFINLGRKDDLNPGKLIGLINDQEITDNVEIGQIEILDLRTLSPLDKNQIQDFYSYLDHLLLPNLMQRKHPPFHRCA